MKTLLYATPAMNLTQAQSAYIMTPILMSDLNAMGIQCFLPRSVVYAPIRYQGLGLPNLYVETGIAHIHFLLQETHSKTHTGTLITISLEATKVEIGVGGPLLTKPYQRYGDLAMDGWVKHTWKFLSDHGMTIEDNALRGCLSDRCLSTTWLQGAALQQLNSCRLYLHADTLSGITTVDGRYLTWFAQHGQHDNT